LRLIVNGVERRDEVVGVAEDGCVPNLEAGVQQIPAAGFLTCRSDRFRRKIIAGEATPWELPRHQVDRVAGSAA
jgi:hypothetical protein